MTELKSLILKTMAAAGALLVMTSPASAYEPTARDLQQAAYAFLMGDWDYQFPMEGGETHLFFKNGAGSTYYSLVSLYPSERTGVFCDLMEVDSCRSRSLMSTFTVDCDKGTIKMRKLSLYSRDFGMGTPSVEIPVPRRVSKSSACSFSIFNEEYIETRKSRHLDLTRSESSSLRRNAAEHPISRRVSAR